MHVDKNSGVNQNQNNQIDIQQSLTQKQQTSVFGNGFPDKNNNGIVDYKDFDDDAIVEVLKNKDLLGCFWGDVYKKVNDIVHFSDKKIKIEIDTLFKTKRKDGYKIKIVTVNGSNPVLQIQGKDKSVVNISISFVNMNNNGELLNNVSEEDKNVRMQLLVDALKELKTNVLKDLSQEVNEIQLSDKIYDNSIWGNYSVGVMRIAFKADYYGGEKLSDTITHEIGHGVDQEPEGGFSTALLDDNWISYEGIFNEYENLLQNIIEKRNDMNDINTYSLRNWMEDFACRYERIEGDSNSVVVDIDKYMAQFENSKDEDEQICYEKYKELDNMAKKIIEEKRKLSRENRVKSTDREL